MTCRDISPRYLLTPPHSVIIFAAFKPLRFIGEGDDMRMVCALVGLTWMLSFGCSDPAALNVDCTRSPQSGDTSINCGDNNDNTTTDGAGSDSTPSTSPVILQAGCYQDLNVCPPAFAASWLIEHCTVPYVCPVRDYGADAGPEERVCLRFIETECWDKYSN